MKTIAWILFIANILCGLMNMAVFFIASFVWALPVALLNAIGAYSLYTEFIRSE